MGIHVLASHISYAACVTTSNSYWLPAHACLIASNSCCLCHICAHYNFLMVNTAQVFTHAWLAHTGACCKLMLAICPHTGASFELTLHRCRSTGNHGLPHIGMLLHPLSVITLMHVPSTRVLQINVLGKRK